MWVVIPVAAALAMAVFFLFAFGAIRDFTDMNRTERVFAGLLNEGFSEFDALVEISRRRHPELSLETHRKMAMKFNDLDKFLGFMFYATEIPLLRMRRTRLEEKNVLALLETTTLINKGRGVYTANTDQKRYRQMLDEDG